MRHTRLIPWALTLAAVAGGTACVTERAVSPANLERATPSYGTPGESFALWQGERLCGTLQRFEEQRDPPLLFWVVRNPRGQDLGMVDALGRAWKYVPHSEQAQWLSTGTVAGGAAAILGIAGELELRELHPLPR